MSSLDPIKFKKLEIIPTSFFELPSIGIQWEIEEAVRNSDNFSFFVERSGSPKGPWEIIAGPLDVNTYIDTRVHRQAKFREVFYRVKVIDSVTSDESLTTDRDASPYFSNWDEDRNRGSVRGFEEFVSGAKPITINKQHLLAMEIVRRNNLLLRRFVGRPAAIFIEKSWGQRCEKCFSETERRSFLSHCPNCFGTGFLGGFFDQVNQFVNFDIEPKVTSIEVRGEVENADDTAWMSNFPIVSPGDVIIRQDNTRWLIKTVQTTSLREVPVRQILSLRCVNPNEKNIYTIPVGPIEIEETSDFIGFEPKGGSGLL